MPAPDAAPEVLPGAEPFAFAGSGPNARTGVLLVHGFTGTPNSMRPWGEHLAAQGFAVRCPLLPGHGTRWQDCNLTTEHDWTEAVGAAFDELAEDVDRVVVAGLSMGGTLAIRLAELRPDDVAALVLVNPSLMTLRTAAKLVPLIAKLSPGWAPIGSDIKKPGVVEQAYPKMPTRAFLALTRLWAVARADLDAITAPVLVFRSREDHVVEAASTEALLAGVASTDTTEVVLENSYHVATLDNDAPTIFAESVRWILDRLPVASDEAAAGGPPVETP